jgi:hypothetical protein
MDRGEGHEGYSASAQGLEGVAANASTRVGEILAAAERYAHEAQAEAERVAAETRRAAQREAGRIAEEAREGARSEARDRAARLAELQAALTARGPAVLEGLEGAGLTRARLEAVIEALAAAADGVIAEAEAGDPADGAEPEPAAPAEAAPDEDPPDAEVVDDPPDSDADPVAAAEELAKPLDGDGADDEAGDGSVAYDGELPEGAPLARKPKRSRERDARFAALLLAVQGRAREEVDAHLRSEYGFDDPASILDEVFGRAPA